MIELPFGLPGHIFRSSMPFRPGDENGQVFRQYQDKNVSVVVLLVTDEECLARAGRNLRLFYDRNGIDVIHLPIQDYRVPARRPLSAASEAALDRARLGKNIAVHCYAGFGRTGMFLACLARRALGMSADQAIAWVRSYIPTAIESPDQIKVVHSYKGLKDLPKNL